MHIKTLILTLVAGLASPAFSQHSVQPLRQAFDHLPQVVGTSPAPIQAYFFDVPTWGYVGSKQIPRAALAYLFFARSIELLRKLSFQASNVWAEKSGIAFKYITYFAGFGQLPHTVSYWGLRDETGARHLMKTPRRENSSAFPGLSPAFTEMEIHNTEWIRQNRIRLTHGAVELAKSISSSNWAT